MKVNLDITVDVDPEAWTTTYGQNKSVREDVKEYLVNQIQQSPPAEECDLKVVKWK
jgi:hypothetical protein